MAWRMSGQAMELCNCTVLCRCWLGPARPDQGWCAGAFVFDVQQGSSDGVDLAGRKAVLTAEWPGDFWSGNGTARVYVDDGGSPDQRRELEAILSGKRGGLFESVIGGVIARWLPSQVTRIDVRRGDNPGATVGTVGQVTLRPLTDPGGQPTVVRGAAAQAAFQIESMNVASSKGSRWADPGMRPWDGDSGNLMRFDWKA